MSHGAGGSNNEKPWDQHSEQKVPIHDEERKHGWDSLSDDRKKQIEVGGTRKLSLTAFVIINVLQVGGGLVAGIAALGAGYFAYSEHKKSEEEVRHSHSLIGSNP